MLICCIVVSEEQGDGEVKCASYMQTNFLYMKRFAIRFMNFYSNASIYTHLYVNKYMERGEGGSLRFSGYLYLTHTNFKSSLFLRDLLGKDFDLLTFRKNKTGSFSYLCRISIFYRKWKTLLFVLSVWWNIELSSTHTHTHIGILQIVIRLDSSHRPTSTGNLYASGVSPEMDKLFGGDIIILAMNFRLHHTVCHFYG